MSYIRALEELRYTDGPNGLYAYPSGEHVVIMPGNAVLKCDWLEVTMRMLERQDVDEEVLDDVQEALEAELGDDVDHDSESRRWGNLPDGECPTCLRDADTERVTERWDERLQANIERLTDSADD